MSSEPFSHPCFVNWGDCDPAGAIFTPRVFDFFLRALEAWYVAHLGYNFFEMRTAFNTGSPTVRTQCDFLTVLRAGQEFSMQLRIAKVGAASVEFIGDGVGEDGTHYFRIRHTVCAIEEDNFVPKRYPEELRQRMLAYQRDCGDDKGIAIEKRGKRK